MNNQTKEIIHIAPDISYLFPETATTATTLCGSLVQEVFDCNEWVGIIQNLNSQFEVCERCKEAWEKLNGTPVVEQPKP
jgi:hypothetical protein